MFTLYMFQGSGFCAPPRPGPGRLQIYLSGLAHGPGPSHLRARVAFSFIYLARSRGPSHARLCAFKHICMHVCMWFMHLHVCMHLCMYASMHICMYARMHVHARTCMYMHVYA